MITSQQPLSSSSIESMLNELNEQQRLAATTIYGPTLVLAGAGSGKTKSLTTRIANMLSQGIDAGSIFCATFTNKAAKEMKERLAKAVGEEQMKYIWMGTFHSLCVRILRKHGHLLGYEQDETSKRCKFVIYDTGDVLQVIERIYKQMNIQDNYKAGYAMHYIDTAKNNLWDPEYCSYHVAESPSDQVMSEVYSKYQFQMQQMNAMDFGDLIMNTVLVLRDHEEARNYWQNKFHFVMSDEFQDANYAQFQLLLLLAAPHYNLFCVGDDYQAIYGFRGSDISIILNFERYFPSATLIKLEQNYRSVGNVVHAGNEIVKFNKHQKEKTLMTTKQDGEMIKVTGTATEYQEAAYIAAIIKKKVIQEGYKYEDFAILYRGNAQSRVIEDFFRNQFIPYTIVGGHSFYDREEIKDTIAYLRAIFNRKDDTALLRVINKPTRGIGKTSQEKIEEYANTHKVSIYRALKNVSDIHTINKRSASKITAFFDLLDHFQKKLDSGLMLTTYVRYVMEQSGLWTHYEKDKKADEKIDNLKEFLILVDKYETENPEKTLEDFLQEVSLVTDSTDKVKTDSVKLMTIHASKGLEFPVVFLNGWNEGVFPSWRSQSDKDLEEERRLAYVGITRAEKELFITFAEQRTQQDGKSRVHKPSRFLEEIPSDIIESKMITA
ncbi:MULTISPECIES: ATP-dependent helicase [Bacillus subtilis group]|uniref:ATP-dependent helicase n=1 Tax=Bacillus subtilis group TaxID=653685 RepID=UPI001B2334F3|nr:MULTISPECIES: ATP-dependent helicase [Bacillus subtilis group]MED4337853.1 ATP-dependent helicase [Bacillus licheniformis]MED4371143.1 ATP-dependent helicase [Bacillus licheniformis]GIN55060.1 DNA helicase [Bacillus paralicheniformis]